MMPSLRVLCMYLMHNCINWLQWCYTALNVTEEVAWEKVSLIICLEYVAVDSSGLSDWDPDGVMQLWWKAKQRRTVQNTRQPPHHPERDTGTISSTAELYHEDLSDLHL